MAVLSCAGEGNLSPEAENYLLVRYKESVRAQWFFFNSADPRGIT